MTASEAVTNSALFQRVPELTLNLCTLGRGQRAFCLGMRHTAYTTSSSILVYFGILRVVRHTRSAGFLMSFRCWNVHDFVQEPDMCEASAPPEI